jgi:hypothetical protein
MPRGFCIANAVDIGTFASEALKAQDPGNDATINYKGGSG